LFIFSLLLLILFYLTSSNILTLLFVLLWFCLGNFSFKFFIIFVPSFMSFFGITYLGFVDSLLLINPINYIFYLMVFLVTLYLLIYINMYFSSFLFFTYFRVIFNIFIISILLYLASVNLFFLFIGWELMGLCSFFLICTFFYRYKSKIGGFKALYLNLFGDIIFLFMLLCYINVFFSLSITFNSFVAPPFILIIVPIMVKSGLYPFYDWLFQAMEGPTPVSAFLHACSMITAGVWLALLLCVSTLCSFVAILFVFLSCVFFGLCALSWFDFKKFIASSTGFFMSFILMITLFGGYTYALFYLYIHASFKFLFFCIAGWVVSVNLNFQDLRLLNFNIYILVFLLFCFVGLFYFWLGFVKENLLYFILTYGSQFCLLFIITVFISYLYSFKFLSYFILEYNTPFSFDCFLFIFLYILCCSFMFYFIFNTCVIGIIPFLNYILFYIIILIFFTFFFSTSILRFTDYYWTFMAFSYMGGVVECLLIRLNFLLVILSF